MNKNDIDKLIAINIMKWEWKKDHIGFGWRNEKGLFSAREGCWNPSTSIKDAWLIVDKLSYGKVETSFKLENLYKGYWATFEINEGVYHSGQQETAPMAICIAALKSIEKKVSVTFS